MARGNCKLSARYLWIFVRYLMFIIGTKNFQFSIRFSPKICSSIKYLLKTKYLKKPRGTNYSVWPYRNRMLSILNPTHPPKIINAVCELLPLQRYSMLDEQVWVRYARFLNYHFLLCAVFHWSRNWRMVWWFGVIKQELIYLGNYQDVFINRPANGKGLRAAWLLHVDMLSIWMNSFCNFGNHPNIKVPICCVRFFLFFSLNLAFLVLFKEVWSFY